MECYEKKEFLEIVKICYKTNNLYRVNKEQIIVLNDLIRENISNIRESIKLKNKYDTKYISDTKKFIYYGNKIFYLKEQLELLLMRKQSLIKNTPRYDKNIIQKFIKLIYDDTKSYYEITSKTLLLNMIKPFIEILIIGNHRIKLYNNNKDTKSIYEGNTKTKEINTRYKNAIKTLLELSEVTNDKYINFYLNTKTNKIIDKDINVIIESKTNLLSILNNGLSQTFKRAIFRPIKPKQSDNIDLEIKQLIEALFEKSFRNSKKIHNSKFGMKTYN